MKWQAGSNLVHSYRKERIRPMAKNSFPFFRQLHLRDCGAVCLKMVAEYYGKEYSIDQLKALTRQKSEGVSLLDISNAAEQIGMHTVGAKLSFSRLIDDIPLPGIAHWKGRHFVVVIEANEKGVTIADPATDGVVTITVPEFLEGWTGSAQNFEAEGIILLMEPTADFYSLEEKKVEKRGIKDFWEVALKDKRLIGFLLVSVLVSVFLTVASPFILEMTVDEGIERGNKNILITILIVWLILYLCLIGLDIVQRMLLFNIGSKVNVKLLTDLMKKLVKIPYKFYQTRMTDDVIQTLYDNPRLQRFFVQESVPVISASLILILFSLVLLAFNKTVCLVFVITMVLQGFSIWFFVKNRKLLSFRRHDLTSDHYNKLTDFFRGVKEIKINNAETQQRWVWERSEAKLHGLSRQYAISNNLALQLPFYLSEIRNIVIIVISAYAVINGQMTVSVLVAIVFILTQLNKPVRGIVQFMIGWQEAKLSIARMNEIHNLDTENYKIKVDVLPEDGTLSGEYLSFRYEGEHAPWVINNLSFNIPYGKTTLIVGPNGSGKTTLMNLMLNFQQPLEGFVKLGELNINEIENSVWLNACGVVQQDGHIFNTSIARNIALGDEKIDSTKLLRAARIANVFEFLDRFNEGFSTEIGEGGVGLSKGQRQSILIARAVYNDPDFLFLDEATNDLDSENEKIVLKRILKAFKGKTIVIVASRMDLPFKPDQYIPLAVPKVIREVPGELSNVRGGNALPAAGESTFFEGIAKDN